MNCTFLSHAEDIVGGSPITYASMSFGTASSDRIIVAMFSDRNDTTGTPSSVTIGGITATNIAGAAGVRSDEESHAFYAFVPTGTSGDVVITYAGATIRSSVALYGLTGAKPVPAGSAGNTGFPVTSIATTLTVPDRGVSMHCAMDRGAPEGTIITWTNSSSDYSTLLDSVQMAGSAHDSTPTVNLVVTATTDSTGASMVISSVAWGPQPEWNFDQQGSPYMRQKVRATGGTPT